MAFETPQGAKTHCLGLFASLRGLTHAGLAVTCSLQSFFGVRQIRDTLGQILSITIAKSPGSVFTLQVSAFRFLFRRDGSLILLL